MEGLRKMGLCELHLEDVVPLRIRLKQRAPGSKVCQHGRALRLLQRLPFCQQHAKPGQDLHRGPKGLRGTDAGANRAGQVLRVFSRRRQVIHNDTPLLFEELT